MCLCLAPGLECVCALARVHVSKAPSFTSPGRWFTKPFPSIAGREKRGGMRERRGRVWFMEETFSLITGRAGLMCTAPMALVTQWWEHTKGLLGGYRVWHIHMRMQLIHSGNLYVQSARVKLCSTEKQYTVATCAVKWICTNTSGNHRAAFTKYPFSTSLWSHTHI